MHQMSLWLNLTVPVSAQACSSASSQVLLANQPAHACFTPLKGSLQSSAGQQLTAGIHATVSVVQTLEVVLLKAHQKLTHHTQKPRLEHNLNLVYIRPCTNCTGCVGACLACSRQVPVLHRNTARSLSLSGATRVTPSYHPLPTHCALPKTTVTVQCWVLGFGIQAVVYTSALQLQPAGTKAQHANMLAGHISIALRTTPCSSGPWSHSSRRQAVAAVPTTAGFEDGTQNIQTVLDSCCCIACCSLGVLTPLLLLPVLLLRAVHCSPSCELNVRTALPLQATSCYAGRASNSSTGQRHVSSHMCVRSCCNRNICRQNRVLHQGLLFCGAAAAPSCCCRRLLLWPHAAAAVCAGWPEQHPKEAVLGGLRQHLLQACCSAGLQGQLCSLLQGDPCEDGTAGSTLHAATLYVDEVAWCSVLDGQAHRMMLQCIMGWCWESCCFCCVLPTWAA